MARYIDADLLLQDISESVVFTVRDSATSPELRGARKIVDRIKNAPTADVVEVKRGEWLQTKEPLGYRGVDCVECSACHDSWVLDEDFDFETVNVFWSFCPNCGAKMERRTEDDR